MWNAENRAWHVESTIYTLLLIRILLISPAASSKHSCEVGIIHFILQMAL